MLSYKSIIIQDGNCYVCLASEPEKLEASDGEQIGYPLCLYTATVQEQLHRNSFLHDGSLGTRRACSSSSLSRVLEPGAYRASVRYLPGA